MNDPMTGPRPPSGGGEYSYVNKQLSGATFIPIAGDAGVFANSCGLMGVYTGIPLTNNSKSGASLAAGAGFYINFGCN